jgi:protein required for attachment to host cells
MPKRPKIWIAMTDGGNARIVTPRDEKPGYDIVTELSSADAHHSSHDLAADRPGRTQESAYTGRHAIEPRSDPHQQEKTAFIRLVAAHLNAKAAAGAFDELILFAPPPCLHELRTELDAETKRKLKHEAAQDLTKLPLAELPQHLKNLS